MDMEGLSKKTTILFPPHLYQQLAHLAASRGTSVGELVRTACERQYGAPAARERLRAVRKLAGLRLPVGSPARMKEESVAAPKRLP